MRSSVGLPPFFAARRQEMPVPERRVVVRLPHHVFHLPRRLHGRRRMGVIQQRRRADEPLVAHQLFRIQPAVGPAEYGVPFSGKLPKEWYMGIRSRSEDEKQKTRRREDEKTSWGGAGRLQGAPA